MKNVIGLSAGLMLLPFPRFALLLVLLWMFWENLGDLTLRIYDDYLLLKTEKALKASLSADVKAYYVNLLTVRSLAERQRRSRAKVARSRMFEAAYAVIARVSAWIRHLMDRGETVSMRPATGEE